MMRAARRRHCGLTLVEMLLSVGLIVLLVGSMFGFYDIAMTRRERGRQVLERQTRARALLAQIAEEIRSSNGFLMGMGGGLSGLRREIRLQTVALPDKTLFERRTIRDKPLPGQSDVREVRYYLAVDPDAQESYSDPESEAGTVEAPKTLGIVRREVKTPFQVAGQTGRTEEVEVDLLSSELRYLRFRFFDGVEWVDIWQPPPGGMGNSLPQAVEITVGYEPVAPEDPTKLNFDEVDAQPSKPEPFDAQRYTMVVRLNQADTFFGSRLMRASRRAGSSAAGEGGPAGALGGG